MTVSAVAGIIPPGNSVRVKSTGAAIRERASRRPAQLAAFHDFAEISVAHLNRRFRQLLRLSPMEYVHSLRMHEAKRLLATTDQNLGQIAAAAGFYDQSYFTKRFRKATGMTPLAYRKHFRKDRGTD